MSVIKSLQTYLEKYAGMELVILTDRTEEGESYALYPAGDGTRKVDIMGNKEYTKNYIFLVKKAINEEFQREENYDFLEEFCNWIEDNNDNNVLPVLEGNMQAKSIYVSNIMLMDISTGWDIGTYQIQIQFTYKKLV